MILKSLFDRIVAFIGLLFLWPVLLFVAILIKIKMPGGPAFFVQKRVGKNGRPFKMQELHAGAFGCTLPADALKAGKNTFAVAFRPTISDKTTFNDFVLRIMPQDEKRKGHDK